MSFGPKPKNNINQSDNTSIMDSVDTTSKLIADSNNVPNIPKVYEIQDSYN